MTKRDRAAAAAAEEETEEPKQRKLEGGSASAAAARSSSSSNSNSSSSSNEAGGPEELLRPFMEELEDIQRSLQDFDEECAKKQMLIQKEYDKNKKPLLEKRQTVLDKIPGFWAAAICNHHLLSFMSSADREVLNLLKSIQLEDNLDDAGSYRIKFVSHCI